MTDGALAAAALRVEDERRRLVHVGAGVEAQLAAVERQRRDIHPDRAVAGGGGVDRHAAAVGGRQQRARLAADDPLALGQILADQVVELGGAHRAVELRRGDQLAVEGVGREQHVVVEEDVVDADDALLAQAGVVDLRLPLAQRHRQPEVGVVVEVRAGRDDPVDEPRLDQRDQRGEPDARPGSAHRPASSRRSHPVRASCAR